mmetsp:Transcript_11643/g.40510  ORF Transcript_11643/g.40510 Transcript_11643/m.40510 type:complete len:555 (+) Transcript_11643:554-2218(+)
MKADVVILTFSVCHDSSLHALRYDWLPTLRNFGLDVPIILVGCKLDLRNEQSVPRAENAMLLVMNEFREVETCLECSSRRLTSVQEVFYYAQKAVLHPTRPLYDVGTQGLKPACYRALKRIFQKCDLDRDGALSDDEISCFQKYCFQAPLQDNELLGIKEVVVEKLSTLGVNSKGLTLTGFLFLHALFIQRGRMETTWTVLRKYGYNNDLRLQPQDIAANSNTFDAHHCTELSEQAIQFIRERFFCFDKDRDSALSRSELEDLFSTAPNLPWDSPQWQHSTETNAEGSLTLRGYLARWNLFACIAPQSALEYLMYLNYPEDPSHALRVTSVRWHAPHLDTCARTVQQCFVLGAEGSGKSSLLQGLVRNISHSAVPEGLAAALVRSSLGMERTLILREFHISATFKALEFMSACDVVVLVVDSSSRESFEVAENIIETLVQLPDPVPCVLVAAKADLGISSSVLLEMGRVSAGYCLPPPVLFSGKTAKNSNLYTTLVDVADYPESCKPGTPSRGTVKQIQQLGCQAVACSAIGAGVAVGILFSYMLARDRRSLLS